MTSYVFIESRDPFESRDTEFIVETATALRQSDNEVIVYLVQNGVLAVRQKAVRSHLVRLAKEGITLLADDFSLRERGIVATEMVSGVQESNVAELVDVVVRNNTKAIWH